MNQYQASDQNLAKCNNPKHKESKYIPEPRYLFLLPYQEAAKLLQNTLAQTY